MKTAEWHQRGRSSDFIVKQKKIHLPILRLDRWVPDGKLLFENVFPNYVT